MALSLAHQGKITEAEELARQVLETMRRVFGFDHPQAMDALEGLAGYLENVGRTEEAMALRAEMVGVQRQRLWQ